MEGDPKIVKIHETVKKGIAGIIVKNENGDFYDLVLHRGAFYFLKRERYQHATLPPDIKLYDFNGEYFADSEEEIRQVAIDNAKMEG